MLKVIGGGQASICGGYSVDKYQFNFLHWTNFVNGKRTPYYSERGLSGSIYHRDKKERDNPGWPGRSSGADCFTKIRLPLF